MDGITNVSGNRRFELTVGETTYTLTPMYLSLLSEQENWILNRRRSLGDLLREIPDDIDAVLRRQVVEVLVSQATQSRFLTTDEMIGYEQSFVGLAHRLLLGLREHHGEEFKTVDDTGKLIQSAGNTELKRIEELVDEVGEAALLKKSDGPTPDPTG